MVLEVYLKKFQKKERKKGVDYVFTVTRRYANH